MNAKILDINIEFENLIDKAINLNCFLIKEKTN
jgi:hypothetical protein